jgi:hypothetical protein
MLLLCGVTGCTYQPRPAVAGPMSLATPSSPEPIRGTLSMGAGDALGERMFIDNAIARGPVLIETASVAGE